MPTMSIQGVGYQFACMCKCGMERFPIAFVPGKVRINCTRNTGITNIICMDYDDEGLPQHEVI